MNLKIQEHLVAWVMTAVLLLLLWLIAGWIEFRRDFPRVRQLTFAESYEPGLNSVGAPIPNVKRSDVRIVERRQIPTIPESMPRVRSPLTPLQLAGPSVRSLSQENTSFNSERQTPSAALKDFRIRVRPNSSGLALSTEGQVRIQRQRTPPIAPQTLSRPKTMNTEVIKTRVKLDEIPPQPNESNPRGQGSEKDGRVDAN